MGARTSSPPRQTEEDWHCADGSAPAETIVYATEDLRKRPRADRRRRASTSSLRPGERQPPRAALRAVA
ncbi:MAG: hypothetical protein M5R42_21390 [Rhodocyclaceae bacterium]|nr:hypothetical protein [Rhodocyclaceae bacterium]